MIPLADRLGGSHPPREKSNFFFWRFFSDAKWTFSVVFAFFHVSTDLYLCSKKDPRQKYSLNSEIRSLTFGDMVRKSTSLFQKTDSTNGEKTHFRKNHIIKWIFQKYVYSTCKYSARPSFWAATVRNNRPTELEEWGKPSFAVWDVPMLQKLSQAKIVFPPFQNLFCFVRRAPWTDSGEP